MRSQIVEVRGAQMVRESRTVEDPGEAVGDVVGLSVGSWIEAGIPGVALSLAEDSLVAPLEARHTEAADAVVAGDSFEAALERDTVAGTAVETWKTPAGLRSLDEP